MSVDNYPKPKFSLPARCAAVLLLLLSAGCATQPRGGLPTFTISGVSYVSLDAVCSRNNIRRDYDGLTRVVSLARDSSNMQFQVGGRDLYLDGRLSACPSSAEYYKGMVVIPDELRRKIDELFAGAPRFDRAFARLKKVVIDPGHGGKDPGASSVHGLQEKDVVLDIARKLRAGLEREGIEVIMTRSGDTFIPLEKRAEIANRAAADLFVSIHANANRVRSLNGFEVYYISPKASDSKRAIESAKEDGLRVDAEALASQSRDLRAILWDMTYSYDRRESMELSRMLCKAMRSNSETKVLGVKNANFCVLRGSTMPAVLAEVGFLTNPSEESLIGNDSYRGKLAERIKEGIRYYCEGLWAVPGRPAQQTVSSENPVRRTGRVAGAYSF